MLHLGDALAGAATAPARLQERLPPGATAAQLALARSLDSARSQSCGRACLQLAERATMEHHSFWFERYLALLRRSIDGAGALPRLTEGGAAYLWASPLGVPAGGGGSACGLCPVGSLLLAEELMALHMYAALLQEQAHRRACEALAGAAPPAPQGASPPAPAPAGRPGGCKKPGLLRRLLTGVKERRGGRSVSPGGLEAEPSSASASPCGSPYSYAPSPRSASATAALGTARAPGPTSPFLGGDSAGATAAARPATAAAAPGEGEAAGGLAAVAVLYRRAAGVYLHIAAKLLPEAQAAGALPPAAGLPVELWPGVAEVLAQACLAQAQGVAAARAEARGSPPALAAALHAGAAGLFEAASAALGAGGAPAGATLAVSGRLPRFLAAGALWHAAAAYSQLAEAQQAELELGAAVACAAAGAGKARNALAACRADADWAPALEAHLAALNRQWSALERERVVVYLQPEAARAPSLPGGRVIVAAAPYQPPADCGDAIYA